MALRETASSPAKRPVRFAPYLQPTHPERKGGAFPFQEFPRSKRIRQPTYPAREGASHFIDGTWYAAATLTNVLRCLRFGTVSYHLPEPHVLSESPNFLILDSIAVIKFGRCFFCLFAQFHRFGGRSRRYQVCELITFAGGFFIKIGLDTPSDSTNQVGRKALRSFRSTKSNSLYSVLTASDVSTLRHL